MSYEVRRATPEELPQVGQITAAGYLADDLLTLSDGRNDQYEAKLLDAASRATAADLLVAVDADRSLLGTVTWCPIGSALRELATNDDQGEFRMLSVSPSARRRGVARALVQACLDRARDQQLGEVLISSLPEMTKAHALYASLGFERAPELDWDPVPMVHLWGFRLRLNPPWHPASTAAAAPVVPRPG